MATVSNMTIIKLITILIFIESGGDPQAIGDGGRAVGILQIHPIMVRECNRLAGEERWTLADRQSPSESKNMAATFISYHRKRGKSWRSIAEGWNSGIPGRPALPRYKEKLDKFGVVEDES